MDSFYIIPKAQVTEEKTGKWRFIKIKNLYATKDIIKKVKWQPTGWE